jgi:hypothetical protein
VIRRDLALALSTGWAPPVIDALDDREKETLWELLHDQQDQMERRQGG